MTAALFITEGNLILTVKKVLKKVTLKKLDNQPIETAADERIGEIQRICLCSKVSWVTIIPVRQV